MMISESTVFLFSFAVSAGWDEDPEVGLWGCFCPLSVSRILVSFFGGAVIISGFSVIVVWIIHHVPVGLLFSI